MNVASLPLVVLVSGFLVIGCSGTDEEPPAQAGAGGISGGPTASVGEMTGGRAGSATSGGSGGMAGSGTGGSGGVAAVGGGSGGVAAGGVAAGGVSGSAGSTGGDAVGGAGDSGSSGTGGVAGGGGRSGAGNGGTAGGPVGGASGGGGPSAGDATIVNDTFWKDTDGNLIASQGGGVLRVGDTYYWYGVQYGGAATYAADPSRGKNSDISFQGITTYSSQDLAHWKLETVSKPSNAGGWFGRLGVVYHEATKKYVLVAQGGGGLYFATSDTPNGPFVYNNVQNSPPGIANGSTGDQTMFQDDDGAAYLVSSSSSGRSNRYLSPLRASDFLAAEDAILVYKGGGREGNCMFKHEGTYYYCSSDLHGWNSSQTYCVSASNIRGPWSAEFVLEGSEPDFSHVTQTGFFISVEGTAGTTIIFAGDRWSDFAGNGIGFNQWLPLSFTGGTPHFNSVTQWSIDASAGTWSVAPGNNYVLNPSFEADRVSMTVPAGWKSTSGSNVESSHTGRWSWQLSGNGSLEQQVTGLPMGTYELSVWAQASSSGAQLYAKGCGTDSMTPIASSGSFANVTLSGLAVSDGECTVGVTAGGGQVRLDDFELSGG